MVAFLLLHTVVVGSISSGGDLIRSKQLFSALYITCRCVPDFLVMAISNLIYLTTRRKDNRENKIKVVIYIYVNRLV